MIRIQLLSPHPPNTLPPQPFPLPPQMQERSRIQMMQLQELPPPKNPIPLPQPLSQPLSHPHPQFVAAKSLIVKSSKF
jgi:hypothetical protein